MWIGQTTNRQRLRVEGKVVWDRDRQLNEIGELEAECPIPRNLKSVVVEASETASNVLCYSGPVWAPHCSSVSGSARCRDARLIVPAQVGA